LGGAHNPGDIWFCTISGCHCLLATALLGARCGRGGVLRFLLLCHRILLRFVSSNAKAGSRCCTCYCCTSTNDGCTSCGGSRRRCSRCKSKRGHSADNEVSFAA
jgi:hypothetical protein